MPVFRLSKKNVFPPPELAEEDGLLALGGDLSEERLLLAYSMGIFPWYSEEYPILWWSPDPRLVLFPPDLKISRSLRQVRRRAVFEITFDTAFEHVMGQCARVKRRGSDGTWITSEMRKAYIRLHRSGYAHSVESWADGELAGGLYGVAIGSAFFGESMFSKKSNASKVAFAELVEKLAKWKFRIIDCQVTTEHLISLGAKEVPREKFLDLLRLAVSEETRRGKWTDAAGE